jgi:hypothetical protein
MTATTISDVAAIAQRVLSEDVLSLSDARQEIHALGGIRPDQSSVTRWCTRGVGGVKLESVRIGNRLVTSRQAITRFIHARTAAD